MRLKLGSISLATASLLCLTSINSLSRDDNFSPVKAAYEKEKAKKGVETGF